MCNICCNHENRSLLCQKSSPSKSCISGPNMVSLVVTITTGFIYRNRSLLEKWHFLDLVCSVCLVTITTGCSYSNRSLLKKWHFLGLICAIYVVTIRKEVFFVKSPLLKKWHHLDLISNRSLLKKGIFLTLYMQCILLP